MKYINSNQPKSVKKDFHFALLNMPINNKLAGIIKKVNKKCAKYFDHK